MQDKYNQAIINIITEQQYIIGPVAYELAKRANGITVKSATEITVTGDPKMALDNVVKQFHMLFGKTSVEVSKKAMKSGGLIFSVEELPEILK